MCCCCPRQGPLPPAWEKPPVDLHFVVPPRGRRVVRTPGVRLGSFWSRWHHQGCSPVRRRDAAAWWRIPCLEELGLRAGSGSFPRLASPVPGSQDGSLLHVSSVITDTASVNLGAFAKFCTVSRAVWLWPVITGSGIKHCLICYCTDQGVLNSAATPDLVKSVLGDLASPLPRSNSVFWFVGHISWGC